MQFLAGTGVLVPAPFSTKELNNNNRDGGNNQKLILFNRGNQFIR